MATDESGDAFTTIFDSVNLSTQVTEYLVGAPDHVLVTGNSYRFKVVAYNYNGPSEAS